MGKPTVLHGIDQSGLSTKRPDAAIPKRPAWGATFHDTDEDNLSVFNETKAV